MDTHAHHPGNPFDAFVEALADSGCELGSIIAHMHAFEAAGRSARDAPPVEAVLRGVLADVLREPFDGFDQAGLQAATRALELASDTVCREIMLVAPEPPNRCGRRRRTRGG